MLVLTRKRSQMIRIGDDVVVKVIKTGQNSVKIGIEAPEHVRVLRAELCDERDPAVDPQPVIPPACLDSRQMLAVCSDQFPQFV